MRHKLIGLLLAPALIYQGRSLRRNIIRLPEAEGSRNGSKGNGHRDLNLLITGDSAAAGVGVETIEQALPGQLINHLDPDFRVQWELLARSGYTTAHIIAKLEKKPAVKYDVVVTSLGVNDVKAGVSLKTWKASQEKLFRLLREKFSTQFILVSAVPPVHLFPALPQPLRWYLGLQAKRFNRALEGMIQGQIRGQADCAFLEMDMINDPSLMAADGFHPGPQLYQLWGKNAAAVINERFKP